MLYTWFRCRSCDMMYASKADAAACCRVEELLQCSECGCEYDDLELGVCSQCERDGED